ncbi:uncharacterized protein F5891DRAFT_986153 [Suillus fuscotomentosus]|uniref:Uncharacterized protein n=1 Tax=Suillus fuscotomentosus TaxID=1912939 RepID=A0AAD4DUL7_9AGAM|nr:uncharacterized protein F5891DRAFT_986153 [Suillus fuscotomentosus]KAG1893163.1 hypothetical protein F5891DRAFT_986153 [Suillus fuscotomentosus]
MGLQRESKAGEGLEGYIIKKSDDLFHVCQEATNEEVEVSKYYLDCRPLTHILQSRPPMQPDFNPLPKPKSLQIRDEIGVVNPDSFCNIISKEVFIIGGARKGYQATLYQLAHDTCSVSVHGQARTTVKCEDVATRMRLDSAILEGLDMISFCKMQKKSYIMLPCRSKTPPPDPVVPSSLSSHNNYDSADSLSAGVKTYDPWVANNAEDIEDTITDMKEKSRNGSPLPWLMNKEFALKLTHHHVVLKVSPSFMGGRLHNRFVSTACPDPFCGENGPAPDGCITVFCTSNGAGAMLQHYHIPVTDLSPAPLRKKKPKVSRPGWRHSW